ncbi:MAG: DUF542 domain-containing protein [Ignavibacteria bacterium]|nr:DUF542 domain-containing protein [Ignavibacteria bacterium]
MINRKITDIVNRNFNSVDLFEKYNLNYSIHGNSTLAKVCRENKISPEHLMSEIHKLNTNISFHFKFNEWDIAFLCDYITANHHSYIKKIFPVIIKKGKYLENKKLIKKGITDKLNLIHSDFLIHMKKEEKLLFPQIKKINISDLADGLYEVPPFGSISMPVRVMFKEHETAFENLSEVKDECNNFNFDKQENDHKSEFYRFLKEFETDLRLHVHLENNILYPKAIKTEKKLLKHISKTKI